MNKAQLVFKIVDGVCYPSQNNFHFDNVHRVLDIPYGDHELTKGDLYYDNKILNDGEKHPIIVYFHGGGFLMGDKKCRVSISEYYAKEGYFVFCVNYRLPPERKYPEMVYDCVDAINFLPELAKKYNIDLDNIVLTGDSAGGYMCAYGAALKYDDTLREKVGCDPIKVDFKGLMLMCGIYDLDVLLQGGKLFGVIPTTAKTLFDFPLKNDLSNLKEYEYFDCLSPSAYINEKWCSTFICWADDDLVCQGQGEPMAEKLKAVVPYFDCYHVGGVLNNHCYHLTPKSNKYAKECLQKSVDFLARLFAEETVTV